EVRIGRISAENWNILHQRHSQFTSRPATNVLLHTTHIVGFKENAQRINRIICNLLSIYPNKFLISQAVDNINYTSSTPSAPWNTT
ncbi:27195_t:CDS:1, partial [Gigaspora margarita]